MIIEVCKRGDPYLREFYHNNPLEMVKAGDGLLFTPERIKNGFNFGRGTVEDLKRHIALNNHIHCLYYDLDKECFI
jgi:hypothetical protein